MAGNQINEEPDHPYNLLAKRNIKVKGSDTFVSVGFKEKTHQVVLVYTGIRNNAAMQEAKERFESSIPERLRGTITYGTKGSEFAMFMSEGTCNELSGKKFDRGAALQI
jgi:hypothetical protein